MAVGKPKMAAGGPFGRAWVAARVVGVCCTASRVANTAVLCMHRFVRASTTAVLHREVLDFDNLVAVLLYICRVDWRRQKLEA